MLNISSEDKYRAQAQLRNFKACGSSATEEGWGRSGVGTQWNIIHAYTTEILSFIYNKDERPEEHRVGWSGPVTEGQVPSVLSYM